MTYAQVVDTTIRNLDPSTYRALKARAVLSGRTVGDVMNEAMRVWLGQTAPPPKTASFFDSPPVDLGAGTETLSEEVDDVAYGLHDNLR